MELYPYQLSAVERLNNGSILCGEVGSGKSRTALAYFFLKVVNGKMNINGEGSWEVPTAPRDLFIITTAKKRDDCDWLMECAPFRLGTDTKNSIGNITVIVDSWQNIKKYTNVHGAFFIFDEQRVSGSGSWVKSFYKITNKNRWILLSATPGDKWSDYIPVFVANGFYKNKSEFQYKHCIYAPYTDFPKIIGYRNEIELMKNRSKILVKMNCCKNAVKHKSIISCNYNALDYNRVKRDHWNIYENCPIDTPSKSCFLQRKVVNSDKSRLDAVIQLMDIHSKVIIFYNYNFELDLLRSELEQKQIPYSEWNGSKHEPIPTSETWAYLVNYGSGAEGWNCIETDTIIFYSASYSYKTMIQAAGRIDRLNTPFTELFYYELYSSAPIDKEIRRCLRSKKDFNEKAFYESQHN